MKPDMIDYIAFFGSVAVSAGLWHVSASAGLIGSGVLLVGWAVLISVARQRRYFHRNK